MVEKKALHEHLAHVDYPVTGREFLDACNKMSDVTVEERDIAAKCIIEDKTYNNEDEIREALNC